MSPEGKQTAESSANVRLPSEKFNVRTFDFSKIVGLSERALEIHRSLYEGYVKESNALLPILYSRPSADATFSVEARLQYDGLIRRFAFERNGMTLHELFFDALRGPSGPLSPSNPFSNAVARSFGSYDRWRQDVQNLALTRGVGWVFTAQSSSDQRVCNLWVEEHTFGMLADWKPLLAIDLWEHAYLIDFKPADRPKYIDTIFENIDWEVVGSRCAQVLH